MCAAGTICHAQDMSPVEPLNKINDAISKMSQKYIEYMSAMAHTNNEKKTEKKSKDSSPAKKTSDKASPPKSSGD